MVRHSNSHLKAIVGPAAKLHNTRLLIKGEILDIHLTGTVVDGWGFPLHQPVVKESSFGCQGHFKVSISADNF